MSHFACDAHEYTLYRDADYAKLPRESDTGGGSCPGRR